MRFHLKIKTNGQKIDVSIFYALLFTILLSSIHTNSYTQLDYSLGPKDASKELQHYLKEKGEAYISIYSKDIDFAMLQQAISIDQIKGNLIYAYVTLPELEDFNALGIPYKMLPKPGELIQPKMFRAVKKIITGMLIPLMTAM